MRRHVPSFRVRYHECDAQGVLFNAHYVTLFDMAITELWRAAFGGYAWMADRDLDIVVGEAHVRYRSAARFDDLVAVAVQVAELGTTSMRTEYEVRRDAELLATGWVRHVFVEVPAMAKTPIPDDLRAALSEPVSTAD